MADVADHTEICLGCDGEAERLLSIPGMIRVQDGNSPIRFGVRGHQTTEHGSDQGFQKEFNAMFFESRGGEPLRHPRTSEPYVTLDNDGGRGRYLGLQSEANAVKRERDYVEHT